MSVTVNGHNVLSVGASTIIFGVIGAFIAFLIINWGVLGLLRSQLCCLIGIVVFFSILFSIGGQVDIAGHLGGLLGGCVCGVAIFPGIREKNKYLTLGAAAALFAYFLIMFLVFFLGE